MISTPAEHGCTGRIAPVATNIGGKPPWSQASADCGMGLKRKCEISQRCCSLLLIGEYFICGSITVANGAAWVTFQGCSTYMDILYTGQFFSDFVYFNC